MLGVLTGLYHTGQLRNHGRVAACGAANVIIVRWAHALLKYGRRVNDVFFSVVGSIVMAEHVVASQEQQIHPCVDAVRGCWGLNKSRSELDLDAMRAVWDADRNQTDPPRLRDHNMALVVTAVVGPDDVPALWTNDPTAVDADTGVLVSDKYDPISLASRSYYFEARQSALFTDPYCINALDAFGVSVPDAVLIDASRTETMNAHDGPRPSFHRVYTPAVDCPLTITDPVDPMAPMDAHVAEELFYAGVMSVVGNADVASGYCHAMLASSVAW